MKIAKLVAGVDEAGRGPLAGPVVAAAVILDPEQPIAGLADSKALSEKRREALAEEVKAKTTWCIAQASVEEIDELNILHASLLAMCRAVDGLASQPSFVQVDGNRLPSCLNVPGEAIIKGDSKVQAISAASILAKTARDALLVEMHDKYPQYQFAKHKGYPTKLHRELLQEHGACPEHRRSYKPVQIALMKS